MDGFLNDLRVLHERLVNKSNSIEASAQTIEFKQSSRLCIMPRSVLRNVFLYLDFLKDIPAVTETCRLFWEIVRSRAFQVKLGRAGFVFSSPAAVKEIDLTPLPQPTSLEEARRYLQSAMDTNALIVSKIKSQDRTIEELSIAIKALNAQVIDNTA